LRFTFSLLYGKYPRYWGLVCRLLVDIIYGAIISSDRLLTITIFEKGSSLNIAFKNPIVTGDCAFTRAETKQSDGKQQDLEMVRETKGV